MSSATGLDRLAAAQDRALERLRAGSPDRELLVQLLENSCLLELAKLDAALDLGSCVQLAADIVTAMFPAGGCAIVLRTDDERPWVVESGQPMTDAEVSHRATISIDGADAGELRLGPLDAELDASRFTDAAAAQLATTFQRAFEGERLRRAAATATAGRLAAELDGDAPADTLEAIAVQLAAFPGALAAELLVDHPAVGAPLTVHAGEVGAATPLVVSRPLPGSGVLAARVAMRAGAPPPEAALGEVLDGIVQSLARIGREQQLRRDVETDPLTGLGNRRRLDRSLAMAMSRAARYGERVAVLLIDFDGFKIVNDTLGHDAGDRVLRNAARAARRVTRGYDEVVRLGGDELVIVSPATELLGALTLAESLRTSIAEATSVALPPDRAVTVSIGVAVYPDSATDADALLRAADAALYEAKARGKDRVAVAPVADFAPVAAPELVTTPSAPEAGIAPPARPRRWFKRGA